MNYITLRCPRCANMMKYSPKGELKKKSCVYCGHCFDARKNLVPSNSRINHSKV